VKLDFTGCVVQSDKEAQITELNQRLRDDQTSIDQLQDELRSVRSELDSVSRDAAVIKRQSAGDLERLNAQLTRQRQDALRRGEIRVQRL